MNFDAIVLAGGRSSRLGGEPKSGLEIGGRTLLDLALDATARARRTVVVGPPTPLPNGVLTTREDPPFGGPASAIAAGIGALAAAGAGTDTETGTESSGTPSDFTLLLACDLPHANQAVDALLSAPAPENDGAVAVDSEGRRQHLLGLYRTASIAAAVRERGSDIHGMSVRALVESLDLTERAVPPGSTADIDTWIDAETFGITPPSNTKECP